MVPTGVMLKKFPSQIAVDCPTSAAISPIPEFYRGNEPPRQLAGIAHLVTGKDSDGTILELFGPANEFHSFQILSMLCEGPSMRSISQVALLNTAPLFMPLLLRERDQDVPVDALLDVVLQFEMRGERGDVREIRRVA